MQPLGLGEGKLALQAQRPHPGEQLLGDQRELQPDPVVLEGREGQVAPADVGAHQDLFVEV